MNKHAQATLGTFVLLIDGLVMAAFVVGLIWFAGQVSPPQDRTSPRELTVLASEG